MSGMSAPDDSLSSDEDPEDLLAAIEYLARWGRADGLVRGESRGDDRSLRGNAMQEVLWFLRNTARHDSLMGTDARVQRSDRKGPRK